jgi:hypothetical protein
VLGIPAGQGAVSDYAHRRGGEEGSAALRSYLLYTPASEIQENKRDSVWVVAQKYLQGSQGGGRPSRSPRL